MISIKNLCVSYQNHEVLNGINLEIKPQDFLVITGPNGSGKTTLLKAILQQIPYRGDIMVDEHDIKYAFNQQRVGYVSQLNSEQICLPISVKEYLNFYIDKSIRAKLFKTFDIHYLLDQDLNNLSGGQRQIVNILKAMSPNLRYLILDEPNTGLDFNTRQQLFNLLNQIHEQGVAIILITHYLDEISCRVNKIYHLDTQQLEVMSNEHCQYC